VNQGIAADCLIALFRESSDDQEDRRKAWIGALLIAEGLSKL
jgi:hypothetical protein